MRICHDQPIEGDSDRQATYERWNSFFKTSFQETTDSVRPSMKPECRTEVGSILQLQRFDRSNTCPAVV